MLEAGGDKMNLSQFLPAMEADDITSDVEKETNKALGKSSGGNNDDSDNMKTDDIFGTSKSSDSTGDDNSSNNNDVSNDDNLEDDNTDDDTSSGSDDSTDDDTGDTDNTDDGADDSGDGSDEDTAEDEPNEVANKKKLMENMITLYNVISNNISLLTDYASSNPLTDESTKTLYNISSNLNDCKTILYKEIVEGFDKKDYVLLLKSYIGVARVYDLCTEMLNKHFDNLELQGRSTHIRRPKKNSDNKSKKDDSLVTASKAKKSKDEK